MSEAEDIRTDDQEYNPTIEPSSAKAWLNLLEESEKVFSQWNDHCDKIDRQFASLERLSHRPDKEFQMFWANCEVIKPSIYAKPPVPVVVPKFKDRRPVYQAASEVMERCATVAFDLTRINDLMILVRDDVALIGRGVAWCRYESANSRGYYATERVCIDFKNRRDFLHSISRTWPEVTWVAAASYLTRQEARKRFKVSSGDAYKDAEYRVDRDGKQVGGADNRERAKFWEIWNKADQRVVWVAKGCEDILDEDDPHLELQNFFPCPKPAYGTVQRGSLVPVPDVMQYKDQLDEIDLLTSRIHALSDALEVKGFYPAGGSEIADAIETAIKIKTPGRLLVPISNWAAFGGSKEVILWLPIDMIAQTITGLVALRKQVIDDVYQIMGLSDIMRGATDPNETLGAQELKTQYGSVRIRDKQQEVVRLARDLVEITSEIITEKFDPVTIIEMSQTQLPTKRMVEQQVTQIQAQTQQIQMQLQQAQQMLQANPQAQQMAQQNPQQVQQIMAQGQQLMAQGQQQIQVLLAKPTIDQVLTFLKDNRSKSFVLDIETDSTIMADENGEKQRRSEFVGVLSQLLPQLAQMISTQPQTAEFCGELLKFATAPFRAGRSLDGAVDTLVEQMKSQGPQQQPQNPAVQVAQMKLEYQKQKDAQDAQLKQAELATKTQNTQAQIQSDQTIAAADQQSKVADAAEKAQRLNLQAIHEREQHQMDMVQSAQEMELNRQKAMLAEQAHIAKLTQMAKQAQAKIESGGFN
jgi:hypothetical protein